MFLNDIKVHFLKKQFSSEQILQKERDIRLAVKYQNEVSSLFDFVMLYMKIWKMSCQIKLGEPQQWLVSTYKFLCEVETQTYDLSKSLLIDAESLKYNPSISVAAIVTVALQINFRLLQEDINNSLKPVSPSQRSRREPC